MLFYFFLSSWDKTKRSTLTSTSLSGCRKRIDITFNKLTQKQKGNALQVCCTYYAYLGSRYNQILPSIYQIVNGLIDFYVDNTHILDMHTCMFVQCTRSSPLCYFLLAPSFLAGSVFSAKVVWGLRTGNLSQAEQIVQWHVYDTIL